MSPRSRVAIAAALVCSTAFATTPEEATKQADSLAQQAENFGMCAEAFGRLADWQIDGGPLHLPQDLRQWPASAIVKEAKVFMASSTVLYNMSLMTRRHITDKAWLDAIPSPDGPDSYTQEHVTREEGAKLAVAAADRFSKILQERQKEDEVRALNLFKSVVGQCSVLDTSKTEAKFKSFPEK